MSFNQRDTNLARTPRKYTSHSFDIAEIGRRAPLTELPFVEVEKEKGASSLDAPAILQTAVWRQPSYSELSATASSISYNHARFDGRARARARRSVYGFLCFAQV